MGFFKNVNEYLGRGTDLHYLLDFPKQPVITPLKSPQEGKHEAEGKK